MGFVCEVYMQLVKSKAQFLCFRSASVGGDGFSCNFLSFEESRVAFELK